jgi:hypothetical protein
MIMFSFKMKVNIPFY